MRERDSPDQLGTMPTITLVSTRTVDRMPLPGGEFRDQPGGPAHYIGEALRRLARPYTLLTGGLAHVEVVPVASGEEYIIPALPKIRLPDRIETAAAIFSPIMQEIDSGEIPEITGLLVVDLQGFVRVPNMRTGESHRQFDLAPLLGRADVVKASPAELERLTTKSRSLLTETMLLTTLGEEGAVLEEGGRRLRVQSSRVTTPDTIGAGDNFLAAFTHYLLVGMTPAEAIECAARFTEKVLGERRR